MENFVLKIYYIFFNNIHFWTSSTFNIAHNIHNTPVPIQIVQTPRKQNCDFHYISLHIAISVFYKLFNLSFSYAQHPQSVRFSADPPLKLLYSITKVVNDPYLWL